MSKWAQNVRKSFKFANFKFCTGENALGQSDYRIHKSVISQEQ